MNKQARNAGPLNNDQGNKQIMVLGLGNILMGDEGFGVHVIRRLQESELSNEVRIEEGGVEGLNLLGHLDGIKRLMVVDVMMIDMEPGELRVIKAEDMPGEPGKQIVSFHQVGVLELMHLADLIGYQPEVTFLVTRPEKMDWSMELSPRLRPAVDKAVNEVRKWCLESVEAT
jgi:hydrogenase maturation protease